MKKVFAVVFCVSTLYGTAHAYDRNFIAQHLRKALNLDTRTQIEVSSSATSSPYGSLSVVPVMINSAPYQIYLSKDEKSYIWGYPIDLTVDPDQMRMKGISLKNVRAKGSATAPVTIVEYTDLQCPYCKNVHDILDKELYVTYSPNDVRLVFKNFPLTNHAWAEQAALASECAGDQKPDYFWKMTDAYFDNAPMISSATIKDRTEEFAKKIGLNMKDFSLCLISGAPMNKILSDKREGTAVGVNSTPTLFINGRAVRGVRTFEDIKVVIDEKRQEANRKK